MSDLSKRISEAHAEAAEALDKTALLHEELAFLDVLLPGTSQGEAGADYQIAVSLREQAKWHRHGASVFEALDEKEA